MSDLSAVFKFSLGQKSYSSGQFPLNIPQIWCLHTLIQREWEDDLGNTFENLPNKGDNE